MNGNDKSHILPRARLLDDSIEHPVRMTKKKANSFTREQICWQWNLHELLALVKQNEAKISKNELKIKKVDQGFSARFGIDFSLVACEFLIKQEVPFVVLVTRFTD